MASLSLAKQHLKVETTDEDTLITAYLSAATAWVENYTGKKLTRGAVTQEESAFGSFVTLQWGPSPDAVTISYTDTDDVAQEITDALVVKNRVYPAESWPGIADNSVIDVAYTAGFSTVPGDLDAAVLLLVGEYHKNREAGIAASSVTSAVESLCRPYRNQLI